MPQIFSEKRTGQVKFYTICKKTVEKLTNEQSKQK